MVSKALASAALAIVLASCAPLSAEAPLFPPLDQGGPTPIEEGRWAHMSPDCAVIPASQRPASVSCTTYIVKRLANGYWDVTLSPAGTSQASDTVLARAVLSPAMDTARTGFSPIFLAEYSLLDDQGDPGPFYAALVPIGPQPSREMFLILQVNCGDVFRDGPVTGVAEAGQAGPSRCMAQTQDGARTAVRRALLESLPNIDASRLVFIGRNLDQSPDAPAELLARR